MKKILYSLMFLLGMANVQAAGVLDYFQRAFERSGDITVRIPHMGYASSDPMPVILVILVIGALMGLIWAILEWQNKVEFLSKASRNVKLTITAAVVLTAVYSSPLVETIILGIGALSAVGSFVIWILIIFLTIGLIMWALNKGSDVMNYGAKSYKDFKESDVGKWIKKNWEESEKKAKKQKTLEDAVKKYDNHTDVDVIAAVRDLGNVVAVDKVVSEVTTVLNELMALEKFYDDEKPIGLSADEDSDAQKLMKNLADRILSVRREINQPGILIPEDALLKNKLESIKKGDQKKIEKEISALRAYADRIKQTLNLILEAAENAVAKCKSNPKKMKEIVEPALKNIYSLQTSLANDYKSLDTIGAQFDISYEELKKKEKEEDGEIGDGKKPSKNIIEAVSSIARLINAIEISYEGKDTGETCIATPSGADITVSFVVMKMAPLESQAPGDYVPDHSNPIKFELGKKKLKDLEDILDALKAKTSKAQDAKQFKSWCLTTLT